MADKLLAEWFWTDRWMGSSGFLLPLEPRGLYREMLTQAWRRGAALPNDPEAIMRATGVTREEWDRCWPAVSRYWTKRGDSLVNETQVIVYEDCKAASDRAQARAQVAAKASAEARAQGKLKLSTSSAQAQLKESPPSAVVRSPSSVAVSGTDTDVKTESSPSAPVASPDALAAVDYWQQRSDTPLRSAKVRKSYLRRADDRLSEGATLEQLKACVDNSLKSNWHIENGYHKQPVMIWKDFGRVQQLAAWKGNGSGQQGYLEVMAEGLALGGSEHDERNRDDARIGPHGSANALAAANQPAGLEVARAGVGSRDGRRD